MYISSAVSEVASGSRRISGADSRAVLGDFSDTMREFVGWLSDPSEDIQLPGMEVTLTAKDVGSVFFTTAIGLWMNDMNSVIETISNFESFKTDLFKQVGQMATS